MGTAQTVATTTPIEDRGTDRQTDIHTTHQSEHSILLEAPSLFVGPNLSGLTCHALEIYSETSSQLSEDRTVDSIVQEPFAVDTELAITDTDTSFRDLGRIGLPSLA